MLAWQLTSNNTIKSKLYGQINSRSTVYRGKVVLYADGFKKHLLWHPGSELNEARLSRFVNIGVCPRILSNYQIREIVLCICGFAWIICVHVVWLANGCLANSCIWINTRINICDGRSGRKTRKWVTIAVSFLWHILRSVLHINGSWRLISLVDSVHR